MPAKKPKSDRRKKTEENWKADAKKVLSEFKDIPESHPQYSIYIQTCARASQFLKFKQKQERLMAKLNKS